MIDLTFKKANILIVDDQEANIDVLEGLLEMQNYSNIKTTSDSREVVPLFASFKPDLILLDLSMPYLSGFEVMEQLKALIPANTFLPILVLTADVASESKQRALSNGASDFLTKPFDLIEVGLRIRNLLYTSFLQQQLQNQNLILEERVKTRTFELEKQNIELIVARDKAEASDRLKSAFINNISHEIRTPLNGILGFGQILTDPDLLEVDRSIYSDMLSKSSIRLIDTVTNFMDIALVTSGNQKVFKKEILPETQMKSVVAKFKDLCEAKNLILSLQIPPDSDQIRVVTDGELFYKILFQLVDNAVKFTQSGSITIGYEKNGNDLHFYVNDTGIGISSDNKMKVFDSFIQEDGETTRRYEGSGLGLAIAKKFVEILDGKIWMESKKGKGSTFYFSLPYLEQVSGTNIQKQFQVNIIRKKQTILIAEDDEINFYYFKVLLTHDNIEILHARNGVEAVDICRNHPEIELVLMDLKMVEMDGFEATSQIKLFRENLPVIAITAYSESEDKQKALKAGCDEFITKPVKKDFLIKKLEEYGLFFHKSN